MAKYVLADLGLIHKYLINADNIARIEDESFFVITVEKDLSNYKITKVGDKLLLSNGAETLVFNHIDSRYEDFSYYLDEFNFEGITVEDHHQDQDEALRIQLPEDAKAIDKQIKAIKYQISKDTTIKDTLIHEATLVELKRQRDKLLNDRRE
jgi:hypothetical protein